MNGFIQVEFTDGTQGQMAPAALSLCLRQNRIRSFRRADGWVVVGIDAMRRPNSFSAYGGPERRQSSSG